MEDDRLVRIARCTDEINACLQGEKEEPDLVYIIGQCDWLWELHLLLYKDTQEDTNGGTTVKTSARTEGGKQYVEQRLREEKMIL